MKVKKRKVLRITSGLFLLVGVLFFPVNKTILFDFVFLTFNIFLFLSTPPDFTAVADYLIIYLNFKKLIHIF